MERSEPLDPMRDRHQPTRAALVGHARLTLVEHPLLATQLTVLRDIRTPPPAFAAALAQATRFLLGAALAGAPTTPTTVPGHSGTTASGHQLARRYAAVAILRAGLGMLWPMHELLPSAPVYQIGVRRDEATLRPDIYATNLPHSYAAIDHLLLLDPMLATGGSARAAVALLRAGYHGPLSILSVIGAPLGVQMLLNADPGLDIFLAALDDRLDDRGFILPGLGDAGDRLFGTQ
ncbi:MAG: uracil phosphoribosyltransferase [Sphaerobacter sp.]|nr:uracil phosphoribosyltransferase [Sphaerobacter sp.]